jgi:hypothetical protein
MVTFFGEMSIEAGFWVQAAESSASVRKTPERNTRIPCTSNV